MSTVRINPEAHERLRKLAAAENCSLQALLEKAIEHYETTVFFQTLDEDFQRLRADPEAWKAYEAEAEAWD